MKSDPARKEIPLTQGKVAIVDDEDYPELAKYKWYAAKQRTGNFYAVRMPPMVNKHRGTRISMHRVIIEPPEGMETDHINGNGLDNRRGNLRVVSSRENHQNLHIQKTSRYPGVTWDKSNQKWQVRIQIGKKRRSLGYYDDEATAGALYTTACNELKTAGKVS
jgi:hypothetical protein